MLKGNKLKYYISGDKLIVNIDNNFNEKKIIPLLIKLSRKNNLLLQIESNNPLLINLQKIINSKSKKEKYELIYDYICDYLDEKMKANNYCDFIDGRCVANRKGYSVHDIDGCCYNKKTGLCKRLVNNQCTTKNVSCKLFFCEYLVKKYLLIKPNDIPQIKYFLNCKQKEIIVHSFFKTREEIVGLLMRAE